MKYYLIIFSLFIMLFPVWADNEDLVSKTADQAITAYHNKDYDTALTHFLYLENNNIINADLFYNIANCYFRQSQIGKAILYYKKALKVDPAHQAAASNLKFILTLTKDKIDTPENGALSRFLLRLYHSFDLNKAALFTAVLFFILIILLILLQTVFQNRDKSLPIFLIFLVVILLVISATISYLKYQNFHSASDAVVIAQTAIGYSGPGVEYTRVFTIHEGMICQIENTNDDWMLIKLPNGIGGWVQTNLLEIVKIKEN
ncbi:MAG: tetratricopeptide repeat protein [Candidatus Cloacimonetes bacterium]|nr:tetratricopeptide repeat protein [Candidatus Cloacimonadota bacterium]